MENSDRPYPESVNQWDWETLEYLEERAYQENTNLEYKQQLSTPDEHTKESWHQELEREFTAFANTNGGIIVFGMNNEIEPAPFTPEKDVRRHIDEIVEHTSPRVTTDIGTEIEPPTEGIDMIVLPVRISKATRKPVVTGDGAYYLRTAEGKAPMPKQTLEQLFVERDRRQQALRQLEMELDRFKSVYEENFEGQSVFDESPPKFELIDTDTLREVLRNNQHLYTEGEDVSQAIQTVFTTLRDIDRDQNEYRSKLDRLLMYGIEKSIDNLNEEMQGRLQTRVRVLRNDLMELAEVADIESEIIE